MVQVESCDVSGPASSATRRKLIRRLPISCALPPIPTLGEMREIGANTSDATLCVCVCVCVCV